MAFIHILIALAVSQLLGANNPFHRDGWWYRWYDRVESLGPLKRVPWLALLIALLVPVLGLGLAVAYLPHWPELILSVVVLLYAWGRGTFAAQVPEYLQACDSNDWLRAQSAAIRQGVACRNLSEGDWHSLHQKMLKLTAYQGFERLFAVIFWFALFGPAGALAYRLLYLLTQWRPSEAAARLLWAMEWLPARLLSASFALTGNFVGCFNRMGGHWLSLSVPTFEVVWQSSLGAVIGEEKRPVAQREILALYRLYVRTLWLWVAVLAFLTIVLV